MSLTLPNSEKTIANGRHYEFDNIRFFATFSVIVIHVIGQLAEDFDLGTVLKQKTFLASVTIAYEAIFRSGIPLFLMLTGALLLPKKEIGYKFIEKRFIRILIPYIIWSLVYLLSKSAADGFNIGKIISGLIFGAHYHLWFVNVVLLIYVTMPFLKRFLTRYGVNGYYIIGLLLFITFVIDILPVSLPLKPTIIRYMSFIGYVTLGYFIATTRLQFLNNLVIGIILTFAGSIITLFGGLGYFDLESNISVDYFSFSTFHLLLRSVGIFIIFKHLSKYIRLDIQVYISKVSKYSFGIYLIHPLVLFFMKKGFNISYKLFHPLVGIPLTAVTCMFFSVLLFVIIDRLSVGKYFY